MISNMLVITSNSLLFSRMISISNASFKLFPLEEYPIYDYFNIICRMK
jgi:hypothetical protein